MFMVQLIDPNRLKHTPSAERRHKRGLCCTPRCKHKHRPRGWFCITCTHRWMRFRDPVRAIFRDKRHNAKTRGIGWHIKLEEFRSWLSGQIGYIEKRGVFADAWTIDRKRSDLPYTIENIQVMTRRVNAYKEAYRRRFGHDAEEKAFESLPEDMLVGDLDAVREALPLDVPCPF